MTKAAYRGTHVTETWIQFQRISPWTSWLETWRQAWRYGTEQAAENIHLDLQSESRRDELGPEWALTQSSPPGIGSLNESVLQSLRSQSVALFEEPC